MIIEPRELNPHVYFWAQSKGFSAAAATVIAGRFSNVDDAEGGLFPGFKGMTPPSLLPDIEPACDAIIRAMVSGEDIVLATDYDCDGVSSAGVLYRAMTEVFGLSESRVHLFSGVRFTEGYGLSAGLAARIHEQFGDGSALVITADMGTSDDARIAWLAERGIGVVVTDHHAIPETGIPASAIAVINPTRDDSAFGDPLIAGCGVAWFTMARLFTRVSELAAGPFGGLDDTQIRRRKGRLMELLAFACSGTVADCVSLARSKNNRLICQAGIQVIRQSDDPCWRVFREALDEGETVQSSHISFLLGPLTNSAGRLVRADAAVAFFVSKDIDEARELFKGLQRENEERKQIEKGMREAAMKMATEQFTAGAICAVIYLEDGHPGVQGICASRVVEQFGKPVAIFSPKGDGSETITASLRSVDGIDIRAAMAVAMARLGDDVPKHWGGHKAAAGMSIPFSALADFTKAINDSCAEQLAESGNDLALVLAYDGKINIGDVSLELTRELAGLGPYGREFETPRFLMEGLVVKSTLMGADRNHMRLDIRSETHGTVSAVQFFVDRIDGFALPPAGSTVSFVGEVSENWFKGTVKPQIILRHLCQTNHEYQKAVGNW